MQELYQWGKETLFRFQNLGSKVYEDLHICDASMPFLPSKPVSANAASIGHYVARNI